MSTSEKKIPTLSPTSFDRKGKDVRGTISKNKTAEQSLKAEIRKWTKKAEQRSDLTRESRGKRGRVFYPDHQAVHGGGKKDLSNNWGANAERSHFNGQRGVGNRR